jgi:hypothetical protein
MNKVKVHMAELRSYLQRDVRGTELLSVIERDVIEQRKKIASLETSLAQKDKSLQQINEERIRAKEEKARLRESLEAETSRLSAARQREARLSDRISELVNSSEIDEAVPVIGGPGELNKIVEHAIRLSKDVRKRFKTIPSPEGKRQIFRLESLVHTYSGAELMDLGKLVALLALFGLPARVEAELTLGEIDGIDEKVFAQFIHWYRTWLDVSDMEEKLFYGPAKGCGKKKTIRHSKSGSESHP